MILVDAQGKRSTHIHICDRWAQGTLDELVGSHIKVVIYPPLLSIAKVVIHALLDTEFQGM